MPLDDAIGLVGRSFEKYIQTEKEKVASAASAATAAVGGAGALAVPTKEISYLLNLLADNRQLTSDELDKVILYLKDRRDKMAVIEGMILCLFVCVCLTFSISISVYY